jgi:hypothetical protein
MQAVRRTGMVVRLVVCEMPMTTAPTLSKREACARPWRVLIASWRLQCVRIRISHKKAKLQYMVQGAWLVDF